MPLFGHPNVEKMLKKKDVKGLVKALTYKKNAVVRKEAAQALGKMGDPQTLDSLIACLSDGIWKHDVEVVVKALIEIGDPQAIKPLVAALKDSNKDAKKVIAEALGEFGDAQAVDPLIAIVKDSDNEVKVVAVEALGKIGDPLAAEALVVTLKNEVWRVLRAATADALGKIGAPSVNPLLELVENGNYSEREAAGKALVKIGSPATKPLIGKLGVKSLIVRKMASKLLGEIGDPEALTPLMKILKDRRKQKTLRVSAARGLINLGWKPEQNELDVWYWVAQSHWEKIITFGIPAVEPLLALLEDGTTEERKNAAEALAKIGKEAVDPLIAALGDKEWYVREGAAHALGEIGDSKAKDPLIAAFKEDGWDENDATAQALKRLGAPLPKPKKLNAEDEKKAISVLNRLCIAYASSNNAQMAKLEPQAKRIGEEANKRGGMVEMRRLFNKLKDSPGKRNLEFFWGGIGHWRG